MRGPRICGSSCRCRDSHSRYSGRSGDSCGRGQPSAYRPGGSPHLSSYFCRPRLPSSHSMHETQLTCGCPPSAAACAPAQVQFLSIIGTVGGSKADPSTKAFSDGFGWSNFEFDLSTGASDDGEDPLGQRRQGQNKSAETSQPGADTSCSGIHEDLSLWMSSLKASGPASRFFQRQITCLAILCCLFAVRVALRKLQMLIYPDDPPPPDMAFPVF